MTTKRPDFFTPAQRWCLIALACVAGWYFAGRILLMLLGCAILVLEALAA